MLWGQAGNDDLDGEAGDDRLFGGVGRDTLDGGRGNDVLTGGTGIDIFEFERGDGRDIITDFQNGEDRIDIDDATLATIDALIRTARQVGNDLVLSPFGDTTITIQGLQRAALDRADFTGFTTPPPPPPPPPSGPGREIDGTRNADTLTGGSGNDEIDGYGGNDVLRGLGGNDELDGDSGNDVLFGGDGRDDLDGGTGADTLYGEAGNDRLEGERGDDVLFGGIGADVFEFERGDGRDTIADFRNGEDRIDLDNFSIAAATAVINGARQVGNDLVLTLSADTSVTIQNFQRAQLDMSDFIL